MTIEGLWILRDAVSKAGQVLAAGAMVASLVVLPHGFAALGQAWADLPCFAYLCLTVSCLLFEDCLRPVE